MPKPSLRLWLLLTAALGAAPGPADGPPTLVAVGRTGDRHTARLTVTTGRAQVTAAGQSVRLADLQRVEFPGPQPPPPPAAGSHHLRLAGEQSISGELLAVTDDRIELRPPWAERLAVPRDLVRSIAPAGRPPAPRPWRAAAPDQDELLLRTGDQLFGDLQPLNRQEVTLQIAGRSRRLPWEAVAAVIPRRRRPLPPFAASGEHVRLALRGADGGWDWLDGALRTADGPGLGLTHPHLGELTIPWASCRELSGGFVGRRVVLEEGPRHLGERVRAEFARPEPEGRQLRWAVRLDGAPQQAWLSARVAHLPAEGAGVRLEAVLNEQVVGDLTRGVTRESAAARTVRLELPGGQWRAGDNALELRLSSDTAADCVIERVLIEVPEAP